MNIEAQRLKFEEYILKDRGPAYLERNDPAEDAEHDYAEHFVQEAWEAWQACAIVQHLAVRELIAAILDGQGQPGYATKIRCTDWLS